jgi:hypothetical protein
VENDQFIPNDTSLDYPDTMVAVDHWNRIWLVNPTYLPPGGLLILAQIGTTFRQLKCVYRCLTGSFTRVGSIRQPRAGPKHLPCRNDRNCPYPQFRHATILDPLDEIAAGGLPPTMGLSRHGNHRTDPEA